MTPNSIPYQIQHSTSENKTRRRKARFQFGFADITSLIQGDIGEDCRRSEKEHEIQIQWSAENGKRAIIFDDVVMIQETVMIHDAVSWKWNYVFECSDRYRHAVSITAQGTGRGGDYGRIEVGVDGESFYELVCVNQLGVDSMMSRYAAVLEAFRRRDQQHKGKALQRNRNRNRNRRRRRLSHVGSIADSMASWDGTGKSPLSDDERSVGDEDQDEEQDDDQDEHQDEHQDQHKHQDKHQDKHQNKHDQCYEGEGVEWEISATTLASRFASNEDVNTQEPSLPMLDPSAIPDFARPPSRVKEGEPQQLTAIVPVSSIPDFAKVANTKQNMPSSPYKKKPLSAPSRKVPQYHQGHRTRHPPTHQPLRTPLSTALGLGGQIDLDAPDMIDLASPPSSPKPYHPTIPTQPPPSVPESFSLLPTTSAPTHEQHNFQTPPPSSKELLFDPMLNFSQPSQPQQTPNPQQHNHHTLMPKSIMNPPPPPPTYSSSTSILTPPTPTSSPAFFHQNKTSNTSSVPPPPTLGQLDAAFGNSSTNTKLSNNYPHWHPYASAQQSHQQQQQQPKQLIHNQQHHQQRVVSTSNVFWFQ